MAIKIDLQSTLIPLNIGEFEFEIDLNDKTEKAFKGQLDNFLKTAEKMDEKKPEDEAKLKEMLAEMYDGLLGKDSFKKLYKQAPSIGILTGVFIQMVVELGKVTQSRITSTPVLKMMEKKKPATKKTGAKK